MTLLHKTRFASAFLSGTFYSVERLPAAFHAASQFNPFFYMIDGFRSGFIGQSDAPVLLGGAILVGPQRRPVGSGLLPPVERL